MASRAKKAAQALDAAAGKKPKKPLRGGVGSEPAKATRVGNEVASEMTRVGAVPAGSVLDTVRKNLEKRNWAGQTWEFLDQIAQDTSQAEARQLMRQYFESKAGSGWESDRLRDFEPTARKAIAARIKQGLAEPDTTPESDPLSAVPAPPDTPRPPRNPPAPTNSVSRETASAMNRARGESAERGLPPGLANRTEARVADDRVSVPDNPLPRERLDTYLRLRKKAKEIVGDAERAKFWKENGFSKSDVATAEKQQAAISDLSTSQRRDARSKAVAFKDPDTGASRKGILPGRTDSADQQYVRDLRAAAGFFPRSVAEQVTDLLDSEKQVTTTRLREPNARTAAGEGGVRHRGDISMETRINALERMLRGSGRMPVDPVPFFRSPTELAQKLAQKHADTRNDAASVAELARTIEARYPQANWGSRIGKDNKPIPKDVPDETALEGAAEPLTNPLPEGTTPIGEPDAIGPTAGDAPPPPKSKARGKKKPPAEEEEVISSPSDDAAVADWAASQGDEPPAPTKAKGGRRGKQEKPVEAAVPEPQGDAPPAPASAADRVMEQAAAAESRMAEEAAGEAPPAPSGDAPARPVNVTDAMDQKALRESVASAAKPRSSADKAGDAVRRAVNAAQEAQRKADEAAAAAKQATAAVDPVATPDPVAAESIDAPAAGDAPPPPDAPPSPDAPPKAPEAERPRGADSGKPATPANRSNAIRNLLVAGAAGGGLMALSNMGGGTPPAPSGTGDRLPNESMSDYVLRKTLYSRKPQTYGTIQHYGE